MNAQYCKNDGGYFSAKVGARRVEYGAPGGRTLPTNSNSLYRLL
jgi:hypothetical protein